MTNVYPRYKTIYLNASVIPQDNITISVYEWTINNSININNLSSISINTNDLKLGENTISLRVQNSCGSWSEKINKVIEVINMEQTFNVVVDKPITNFEVIMNLTGTVIVTVKDSLGNVIVGATVIIDTVTSITNTSGIAILNEITYGIKTGTVKTT